MRRYWSDSPLSLNKEIQLSPELFHHICEVCRLPEGAKFELITEEQKAYLVRLVSKSKKTATIHVLEERQLPSLSRPYIRLCISLPKFNTFESILEKSVELGVHRIQPFFSDFSFVRNLDKISGSRWQRWLKIIKNASQQTGRSPLMTIEEPCKIEEILQDFNPDQGIEGLFPYEGQGELNLKESLARIRSANCQEVWVFIGSEGGFSDKEVELFQSVKLFPLSLGEQVLRVETACVALTSIIKYDLNLF